MILNVIIAVDKNFGIGYKGNLPWSIPEEIKVFREKTLGPVVICGSRTFSNLPKLPDRTIFYISKYGKNVNHEKIEESVDCLDSFEGAIIAAQRLNKPIFVIGGSQVYNYAFKNYKKQIRIHISFIKDTFTSDIYFDKNNFNDFYIASEKSYTRFTHCEMEYREYGEWQYLNLLRDILQNGDKRTGRNGEVISVFSKHLKFDLRNGFPLLTTKKMFLRGIIEELLFFIRGDTNSKLLEEKGINIWKGNTSREFLDLNGFESRKAGELGPMYGYQWRNFNGIYYKYNPIIDRELNEEAEDKISFCNYLSPKIGVDQLTILIDQIKTNPTSRRLLLTSYNPGQSDHGVLFPCHSIIIQFYVKGEFLDLFCYNRSNDNFHGTPFNIASTSLLLMIVAQIVNLTPRYVNISQGDSHIYGEHTDAVITQISRIPYRFPKLSLPPFSSIEEVEKIEYSDFKLEDYNYHLAIKVPMVV